MPSPITQIEFRDLLATTIFKTLFQELCSSIEGQFSDMSDLKEQNLWNLEPDFETRVPNVQ